MYDFKLNKNEIIKIISDDGVIYANKEERNVTFIITNLRLLILDYPSGIYNSAEDLRISGKMNYIRKKEIISEINLNHIVSITKQMDYYKIALKDKKYINLNDDSIIEYLNKEEKWKRK